MSTSVLIDSYSLRQNQKEGKLTGKRMTAGCLPENPYTRRNTQLTLNSRDRKKEWLLVATTGLTVMERNPQQFVAAVSHPELAGTVSWSPVLHILPVTAMEIRRRTPNRPLTAPCIEVSNSLTNYERSKTERRLTGRNACCRRSAEKYAEEGCRNPASAWLWTRGNCRQGRTTPRRLVRGETMPGGRRRSGARSKKAAP